MLSNGTLIPSSLSVKDLLWQVQWDKEKCTLCGRCTAVCPVQAIDLGTHRKRTVQISSLAEIGPSTASSNVYKVYHGIRQKTDPSYACIGCAMCNLVCPNGAIIPLRSDEIDKNGSTSTGVGMREVEAAGEMRRIQTISGYSTG